MAAVRRFIGGLFLAVARLLLDPPPADEEAAREQRIVRKTAELYGGGTEATPYMALFAAEALELAGESTIVDIFESGMTLYARARDRTGDTVEIKLPRSTEVWQESQAPLN